MKIIIYNEISTTEKCTFNECLNPTIQLTKGNPFPFRRVSIITSGNFLQLSPVTGKAKFQPPKNIVYNCLGGNLWVQLFKIHELTEIVRQSSDPRLAEVLSRIGEGSHTDVDSR